MPQFMRCLAITARLGFFSTDYSFLSIAAHESDVLNHFNAVKTWLLLFLFLTIYNKSVWSGFFFF